MSAGFCADPRTVSQRARRRNRLSGATLGLAAALPLAFWLRGFTVDDALISARVATRIAAGLGQRFNAHGPLVDAVTPLGYAQLLAPFGRDVLATFHRAKLLGLAAWFVAAAVLGALAADAGTRLRRFVPLLLLALSSPLAAWAASGMETGLVTLLVTIGLTNLPGSPLALGCAAAFRPELFPFASCLVIARLRREPGGMLLDAAALASVTLPCAAVAVLRRHYFGHFVPLAFYAKPSDFGHGLQYALGAFVFTGLPWLCLALPGELRCLSPATKALAWACCAHFAALVLCGGDWMSLYRLVVPVLPCAALFAAHLAEHARLRATIARSVLAAAGSLILLWGLGPAARRVGAEREALIAAARPSLAGDARIASVDVGWVGAASAADVIDLAGVTDAEVAYFPGGHTSKRIPRAWLLGRAPSAIVLLLARGAIARANTPIESLTFARSVEARVAEIVSDDYRVRGTLPLGDQTYVVLEPDPERAR